MFGMKRGITKPYTLPRLSVSSIVFRRVAVAVVGVGIVIVVPVSVVVVIVVSLTIHVEGGELFAFICFSLK